MRSRAWMFCSARFSAPVPPSACHTGAGSWLRTCSTADTVDRVCRCQLDLHPEARRAAHNAGQQGRHGAHDRVDLHIQVVCAYLRDANKGHAQDAATAPTMLDSNPS